MLTAERVTEIDAPRETVWEVLSNHAEYDKIVPPVRRAELERPGDTEPNGVGAIRALHIAGPPLREEILSFDAPNEMSYSAISGIPAKKHLGTVKLEDAGAKTRMTYRIDITPYGPGFVAKPILNKVLSDLVGGIKKISEQKTPA